jgi:integrase/recombinase XerD
VCSVLCRVPDKACQRATTLEREIKGNSQKLWSVRQVVDRHSNHPLCQDDLHRLLDQDQRKHTAALFSIDPRKANMSQAKTLTQQELRRVTDYVATRKHAARNRAMLLVTHLSGMRVGEVAALRISDVLDMDGDIRNEIRLDAEQTKGQYARVVFVSDKLRKELKTYLSLYTPVNSDQKLFYTQKRMKDGFSANTLAQHFHHLYRAVGIEGASSHSGRRSFITNLASKGVGVRVLMSLAGHRNISTTQAYIDVNDNQKRAAVELV